MTDWKKLNCASDDHRTLPPECRRVEAKRISLSSFEVTPPHSLEQGDRRERGQRVEASD